MFSKHYEECAVKIEAYLIGKKNKPLNPLLRIPSEFRRIPNVRGEICYC